MTPHDKLLARSAEVFGFDGDVVKINLREGPVAVTVKLDEHEHARRTRAGVGAITDREVVTALWELPHALPVERSAMPDWACLRFWRLPAGVVEITEGSLTRVLRPPLNVTGVLAVGRKPERLVQRVGQLSAVASMAIVVQGDPAPDDPWILNAGLYGMGVARSRKGQLTCLSEPLRTVPMLGVYRWWICERAYKQTLACDAPALPQTQNRTVTQRLFEGVRVPDVHVFGQTLDIWINPRTEEINRRAYSGSSAALDESQVCALMTIPEGVPVEMRALDGALLLEMEGLLEANAIDIIGDSATRRAIPPVDLMGFAKTAHEWTDLSGVTLLATHGPRIVLADEPMARRILREIDPEVGVALVEGSDCVVVRGPGVKAVRPSWQRWVIAEAAFDVWQQRTGSVSRTDQAT